MESSWSRRDSLSSIEWMYGSSAQLPLLVERGLQAASPSALSRRPGISQGPWDRPTPERRKRRAPFACATATLNRYEWRRGQGRGSTSAEVASLLAPLPAPPLRGEEAKAHQRKCAPPASEWEGSTAECRNERQFSW